MNIIFKNSENYLNGSCVHGDFIFNDGILAPATSDVFNLLAQNSVIYDNCLILPGFCDMHVHFREPGFSYKEDMHTGSLSALAGGYTDVATMPNLNPVPDSVQNLKVQLDAIKEKATVRVHPFGALTVGERGEEISDLEGMCEYVVGFSDDGKGVQSEQMMATLMRRCASLGKIISAHCEDNSLLRGGYIHDGKYAETHNHKGICSESEWRPIARDIELAKQTGAKYHVCHISTKESVNIIRQAKADGVDITCETAPHYLILDDSNLMEDGRFKMNPPLRDKTDREALIEGVLDGTIDMIATDHAPHSIEEKSRGLEKSAMGVVGLEVAFPELYTHLVRTGILSVDKLLKLMVYNPRERFGLTDNVGFSVWDVERERTINPNEFKSLGRSTPFDGDRVFGTCLMTVSDGKVVYKK